MHSLAAISVSLRIDLVGLWRSVILARPVRRANLLSEYNGPESAGPTPDGGNSGVPQPPAAGPTASPSWGMAPPSSSPSGTWAPTPGPSYPWGPPSPPARPKRTSRVHVIWLVVALVAAIGSGTTGFVIGKSSAQISTAIKSGAAAAGARPCVVNSPAPGVGARLARELLPLPAGAKYINSQYRPSIDSLNQLLSVLYPGNSIERGRFVARCFQVAAQQGWAAASGQIVAFYLLQFGTPADARSYALADQSADLADPLNKQHSTVSGVSDGIAIDAPALDKSGNTIVRLIGDKGNVALIIQVFTPAHLPSPASAAKLLRQQAARL